MSGPQPVRGAVTSSMLSRAARLGAFAPAIASVVAGSALAQGFRPAPPASFDQGALAGAMRYRMIGPARGGVIRSGMGLTLNTEDALPAQQSTI